MEDLMAETKKIQPKTKKLEVFQVSIRKNIDSVSLL